MPTLSPADPNLRRTRRQALFAAWLARLGPVADAAMAQALARWVDAAAPAGRDPSTFAELAARLAALQHAGGVTPPTAAMLARALAEQLLADACASIGREAARAGHAEVFAALRPWLHRPLPDADRAHLARSLGLAPAALDLALRRLRGRYRQRIDAGMALWSPSATGHAALRRELHAALLDLEATP